MSSKAAAQAAARRSSIVKGTIISILCISALISAFQLGERRSLTRAPRETADARSKPAIYTWYRSRAGKLYEQQQQGASSLDAGQGEAAPRRLSAPEEGAHTVVQKPAAAVAAAPDPRTTPYYRQGATRFDGPVAKKPVCLNTCSKVRRRQSATRWQRTQHECGGARCGTVLCITPPGAGARRRVR